MLLKLICYARQALYAVVEHGDLIHSSAPNVLANHDTPGSSFYSSMAGVALCSGLGMGRELRLRRCISSASAMQLEIFRILYVHTGHREIAIMTGTDLPVMSINEWQQLLNDTPALLLAPKKHHMELLHHAYALRDSHVVDSGTLADMLELADEALMYAHSVQADQHW
ncbi:MULTISPECIES: hypothetical protein [Pseudomonas]|uniref:hypothetical protein n=1 Tax=Pseudomonas TaxID=286 RepID=UPI0018CA5AD2|nr:MULTISPECIES: hypothetical protein [Pseudomonas]MCE0963277.1 hypothetical protein [Pseudomonas putida]